MALGDIVTRLKSIYDRLIAGVVLIGLVASLAYLAWHVGTVQNAQEAFIAEIDGIRPAHPEAQPVDVSPYEAGLNSVRQPTQIEVAGEGAKMWVPGMRVACIDCRRPIPFDAQTCPFCRAKQPDEKDTGEFDLDSDGMKDGWEKAHGLSPTDPTDAAKDGDGDGFTNLEEFLANPQTDPTDQDDSPNIVVKLCLQGLSADPFHLLFKSVIKLPGGNKQFAINTRGNSKTYFKKLGEEVEGFTLHEFEPKLRRVERFGRVMNIDVSVLTLKRGDKLIKLTKGKRVEYKEYTCTLLFKVDDSTYTLAVNDEFDLQGKRYKLIGIDSATERVVIKRVLDGLDLQVRKCAESDDAGAEPAVSTSPLEQGVNS
jgi:hypothetical protein